MTRVPFGLRVAHGFEQSLVLTIASLGWVLVTWSSPVGQAALADLTPLGRLVVPFAFSFVLGLPVVLTRQRAFVWLWLAAAALLCALSVVEVSRLNWATFVSGVAFRVGSGPVPLVRTLGGLVVLLSGLLLLGQQNVQQTLTHVAERGVRPTELAELRRRLVGVERLLVAGCAAAGVVLSLVAFVSMRATEQAPSDGSGGVWPLAWTGLLLGALVAAFALGAWRRRTGGHQGNRGR